MSAHAKLLWSQSLPSKQTLFKLTVLAFSILVSAADVKSASRSELIEFGSATRPYLAPRFVSADGSTIVGELANNNGNHQVAIWSAGLSSTLVSLGGAATYVNAMSDNGQAIVGTSQTSAGETHAYRWLNGTMSDLGTLGGASSNAQAVSSDGAVVVGYSRMSLNSHNSAFRWENGTMQDLGTLGGVNSYARAVSANGAVVVGESNIANGDVHGFLWENNALTDLGTLGGNYSRAVAVNADGSAVIGESLLADNSFTHAFHWSNGIMLDLGTLGGHYSIAQFVSADGSVVVGRSILADNLNTRVFRWTNNTLSDIGSLGGTVTTASDMNADGSIIVGRSRDGGNQYQAYRWTKTLGMQSVENWLGDNGISVQGSSPVTAAAVSDDGNVIVGQLGNGHSYLARIIASSPPSSPGAGASSPPSSPGAGSGMIDIDDYLTGLVALRVQTSSLARNLNDLTLNGLHGNPMRGLLAAGKQNLWISGDIGRSDHGDFNGNASIGEIGYGIGLVEGLQVNLALGRTWNSQKGSWGSHTKLQGSYLLPELIARIPHTSFYATVSGLYNDGHSDVERGYLNAGSQTSSQGTTSVKGWGGRIRLDWLNALTIGTAGFTPYGSHTYLQTNIASYTETGGGFPVAWESSRERTNTSRLGIDATQPLNSRVTMLGRIESAHHHEKQGNQAKAHILGEGGSSLNVPGRSYKRNWMRIGTGVEIRAGSGIASVLLSATSEGENPDYWLSAGYQLRF